MSADQLPAGPIASLIPAESAAGFAWPARYVGERPRARDGDVDHNLSQTKRPWCLQVGDAGTTVRKALAQRRSPSCTQRCGQPRPP